MRTATFTHGGFTFFMHTGAFTFFMHRCLYTLRLLLLRKDAFTNKRRLLTERFGPQVFLHKVAHTCPYTLLLFHTRRFFFTQTTRLYSDVSTRRHCDAQEGPESFYTHKPLHTERFCIRCFYIQALLHTEACVTWFIAEHAFWVVHSAARSARQRPRDSKAQHSMA